MNTAATWATDRPTSVQVGDVDGVHVGDANVSEPREYDVCAQNSFVDERGGHFGLRPPHIFPANQELAL